MKKFDWKKVVIVIFALVLCFSLAACVKDKPVKRVEVKAEEFINKLVGGVSGIISALGNKDSSVKHVEATVVVQIGSEGRKLGEDANIEIKIAGNFDSSTIGNNDIKLEVIDQKAKKILIGLYENKGKIYLQESMTTADGAVQKLSIEGVAALNLQTYLAKLPDLLSGMLGGIDVEDKIGAFKPVIASVLGDLMTIYATEEGYSAEVNVKGLSDVLGTLETILAEIGIEQYEGLINMILEPVLGVKMLGGKIIYDDKQTFPELNLNVNLKDNVFNGLTFDYKWKKSGDYGNDTTVHVGLKDINISNTSAPVTTGMDFSAYAPGALKVSADLNIPELTSAGFRIKADFYLQPGFGTIDGSAASENEFLKLALTATDAAGKAYDLKAEYKYVDEGGKRVGRIYFDMEELCRLASVTAADGNYKFYANFDVAELLISLTNPTQKDFEVEGLADGFTATMHLKAANNHKYYAKNDLFDGNYVWRDVAIKNAAGASVGTVVEQGYDKIEKETYAIIKFQVDGVDTKYRVVVTDEQMLTEMKAGASLKATAKAVATVDNVRDAYTGHVVFDTKDQIIEYAEIPTENYYEFIVYNGNQTIIAKEYFFLTAGTSATEQTEDIRTRLTKDGGILDIIAADSAVKESETLLHKVDLYTLWQHTGNIYSLNSDAGLLAMKSGDSVPVDLDGSIKSFTRGGQKSNYGMFIQSKSNNSYKANLFVVLKQKEDVTIDSLYESLDNGLIKDETARSYVDSKLSRVARDGKNIPTMTKDIEIAAGAAFNFNLGALGGIANILMEKIGKLTTDGTISISLKDVASIIQMGAYFANEDMFAAQIRMLLSGEKSSEAYAKYALAEPYVKPVRTIATEPVLTGNPGGDTGSSTITANYSQYQRESLIMELYEKVYGSFTEEKLYTELGLTSGADDAVIGIEGWSMKQAKEYVALVTTKEKADYFFNTMLSTYAKRLEKRDAAYTATRAASEAKAMDFIRGYIGGKGTLDSVATVKDFLYGADGNSPLTIELAFQASKGVPVIAGMPMSLTARIKRGTTLIGEVTAGVQFIKASDIPASQIPANYWDGAKNVTEVSTENPNLSNAVKLLMQVHASFLGYTDWTDLFTEYKPVVVA